ncbi:MAG: HD domain-containing protein [Actinobacteria bacterium]|nr:HD domain-containing protein [Actinomycetota bacterium]
MSDDDIRGRALALAWAGAPEERLDAVLALAASLAGMPRAHLYLAAGDERRLHLERTHGISAAPPRGDAEGGAGVALPLPPLELRVADDEDARIVPTPEGSFYSLPLRGAGGLVGTIRVGPIASGKLPRGAEKDLRAAAPELAVVVAAAHEADALGRRADDAEKRVAVGRRLQGSSLETGRFVTLLLRLAVRSSGADGGFVAIADGGRLTLRASDGLEEYTAAALATDLVEIVTETQSAFLRDADAAERLGVRSILAVPLIAGVRVEALLALVDLGGGRLDPASLVLLETLAEHIRLMLGNEQLFDEFVDRYLDTLRGLAESLDARSPATIGHHARVAAIADAVALELGLPSETRDALRTAALVHDVGLAGVAATPDAYIADIEHPTIGAGMLEALPLAPGVVEAVEGHHEWFDGWGFPRGSRGDQLHPLARVLALAEFAVEAAGGDAVQPPWPPARLANEIRERRGSQFDPEVADAAVRLLDGGRMPDHTSGGSAWST